MAAPDSPSQVAEQVDADIELFRAFADKNFRERKTNAPHVVRYWAYLLREDDVVDGLSVGLSPKASVKYLARNYGYCSINSGSVTALPDGLCIRRDAIDGDHAFICNLPLRTESDEKLNAAMRIAKQLARQSKVVTCDPFRPT